jgi:hypothetical protein
MVGGSYAQTGLPSPLASASYSASNQLTQFGPSILTYDANGNLSGGGTHTYTWDARNRLVGISGGVSASFQYDAFGRRVAKTIGAATTNYLYDGVNPVQELVGGAPAANLLTGLDVDEYFQRTDANGAANRPTRYIDPHGANIAVVGDVSAYVQARKYLLRDPVIAPVIRSLQTRKDIITIRTTDSTDKNKLHYDSDTKTITWNPHAALKCVGENARGSLSPAAALAHELVHAYMDTWWNFGSTPTDDDWETQQEKYVIEEYEHHLIDLGEGIRYNHHGVIYTVPSVTGR